jgi:hypothetical protein
MFVSFSLLYVQRMWVEIEQFTYLLCISPFFEVGCALGLVVSVANVNNSQ